MSIKLQLQDLSKILHFVKERWPPQVEAEYKGYHKTRNEFSTQSKMMCYIDIKLCYIYIKLCHIDALFDMSSHVILTFILNVILTYF